MGGKTGMNIVTDFVKVATNRYYMEVKATGAHGDHEVKFVVRTNPDVERLAVTRETENAITKIDFIGSIFDLEMMIEALQTAKIIYDREKGA